MEINKTEHRGSVKKGKLFLNDLIIYQHCLDNLDDKKIVLTLQEDEHDPTLEQFSYYNGVILKEALQDNQFNGWTKNELDYFLSDMFLGNTTMKVLNNIPVIIKSTPSKATISRKKYAWFIDQVIIFMSQIGIEISEADKYKLKQYHGKTKSTSKDI